LRRRPERRTNPDDTGTSHHRYWVSLDKRHDDDLAGQNNGRHHPAGHDRRVVN
jgi:hypothetical protein